MANSNPLVSIGVPFYNSENYIEKTLDSIKLQTYANLELILIDDCSADRSLAIVQDWLQINSGRFINVALLKNGQNRGTSYSCRRLQHAAKGVFFEKLDADDIIFPNKISRQVECMISNPEVAIVYSNTQLIDSDGNLLDNDYFGVQKFCAITDGHGPSGFVFDKLIIEDFIPNSSVLIRKNILDEIGGYDETLFTEDWDLWLRICSVHPVLFLEGYYSQYRIHPQSVMRKRSTLVKSYLSSIRAVLKHEGTSKQVRQVVAKHLNTYSVGMYRYGVIEKDLLRKNFMYNKTFKSAVYYILGLLKLKLNQKK